MPRKDGASRRLAEEIAVGKRIRGLEETPKKAPEGTPKKALERRQETPSGLAGGLLAFLGESQPDGIALWDVVPQYLEPDENVAWDRPILGAFKAFDLDPRYLSHWRQLLGHLAYVLFPNRRAGPQRIWTDERLCRLLADVAAYKRKNPKAPDTAICNWLKSKWPKDSPARLRRVLQDARNPALNGELARVAYDLVSPQMLREAAGALMKKASWTEADEKYVLSKAHRTALTKAIEEADKLWGH